MRKKWLREAALALVLTLNVSIFLGSSRASAQALPGGPALNVADTSVSGTGMTRGGAVVWLAITRQVDEYEPIYTRLQGMTLADAQGQVQIPVASSIPLASIWLAIDLTTGAYATASPAGFSPAAFGLGADALNVRGGDLPDQLVDAADYAEILLVRPGLGAWGRLSVAAVRTMNRIQAIRPASCR